ncbi:hypothetical protein FO519_003408 [Halicephalobus sp. NKZ332]|nr:hypothetical protein FO519_003408 [Halicephalobus sp. NKZ332]
MVATWADIQRLAADLQRAQLAHGADRLSDANCVEIISKLIDNGSIEVVFTVDRKDYITKKHLLTEIKLQCASAGGRIPITELAAKLKIDFNAAKQGCENLLSQSDEYLISHDELIAIEYVDDLCQKLNELLAETGKLSILSLTKSWNAPIQFLNQYVFSEVGNKIKAQRDNDLLYTNDFVDAQCRKLRAILVASSGHPSSLSTFFERMDITESLFFMLVNRLSTQNQLCGAISGPKNSLKSLYIPNNYEKRAREYVLNRLKFERWILNNDLKRLHFPEPQDAVKKMFADDKNIKLVYLRSQIITEDLYQEFYSFIVEKLEKDMYCNLEELSTGDHHIESTDFDLICTRFFKDHPKKDWVRIEHTLLIYDRALLQKAVDLLRESIKRKAVEASPKVFQGLKELHSSSGKKTVEDNDDDWKSGGKGGKKKGGGKKGGKKAAADETLPDTSHLYTIPKGELEKDIKALKLIPGFESEIYREIAPTLDAIYRQEIEAQFTASSSKDEKQAIQEKQKQIQQLYDSFCWHEEAAKSFTGALSGDLVNYLLKTVGNEIAITVLSLFVDIPGDHTQPLSSKVRNENINSISDKNVQKEITELFEGLNDVGKFHNAVRSLDACSIFIKPPEKNSKTQYLNKYTEDHKEMIRNSSNAAETLLLIVICIVAKKANLAVRASGKFVAPITNQLVDLCAQADDPISQDVVDQILAAMPLVVKYIQGKIDESGKENLNEILKNLENIVLN